VDAEETDEVNGIGGVVGLMQDAVAPQLLGDQADLVEAGTHRGAAAGSSGAAVGSPRRSSVRSARIDPADSGGIRLRP
jgi:hypothetical protein